MVERHRYQAQTFQASQHLTLRHKVKITDTGRHIDMTIQKIPYCINVKTNFTFSYLSNFKVDGNQNTQNRIHLRIQ